MTSFCEVIDNFLPSSEFSRLRDLMMSNEFSWYFQDEVTYPGVVAADGEHYFTHTFYTDHKPNSVFYEEITPIVDRLAPAALIRVKGNLYPNIGKQLENGKHRDFDFPNRGAVLSINTCNAFTRLEDGTKIESVANRLVIFDGSTMHNSSHCTDQSRRVNININYIE